MPRALYRPRPWKLRYIERDGTTKMEAYRWENTCRWAADWLERNGYAGVTVTFEEPAKERPL